MALKKRNFVMAFPTVDLYVLLPDALLGPRLGQTGRKTKRMKSPGLPSGSIRPQPSKTAKMNN